MGIPMAGENQIRPRVGIPYRTTNEEVTGDRLKYEMYTRAVQDAGGDPVEISLTLSHNELQHAARTLDAIVLPGSPADVNPALYQAQRHLKTAEDDEQRERTDFTLLEHAYAANKPVLAICYGIQSLNVFRGGSLIQDIASESWSKIQHPWENSKGGAPEPFHSVVIEGGTRLAQLAGAADVRVNSSHHQAIRDTWPRPADRGSSAGWNHRSSGRNRARKLDRGRAVAPGAHAVRSAGPIALSRVGRCRPGSARPRLRRANGKLGLSATAW